MALLWCVPQDTMLSRALPVVSAFSILWQWLLVMLRPSVDVPCGKGSLKTSKS